MPKMNQSKSKRKQSPSKQASKRGAVHPKGMFGKVKSTFRKFRTLQEDYLKRRPHRAFRRTLRRDYRRELSMPGYVAFTLSVWRTLLGNKALFTRLVLFYAIAGMLFVGLSSQDTYSQLSDLIDETGPDLLNGGWGSVGKAGLLLFSGLTGSFTPEFSEVQQVYSVVLLLLTWLTTVWLLRATLSGKNPKLRDGLYRAGAPIVSTGALLVVLAIQLIPGILGALAFNAAINAGIFDSGLLAMVISIVVGLLIILSLYWATSTVIGLIVVTLPGMYPWEALKAAGDLVVGRRLRILQRVLWMLAFNFIFMVIVILPIIIIERLLKQAIPAISGVPIVPVAIALVTAFIMVWSATYVYLLYRKVVEDDSAPA